MCSSSTQLTLGGEGVEASIAADHALLYAILNIEEFPGCYAECRAYARRLVDLVAGKRPLTGLPFGSVNWHDDMLRIKDALIERTVHDVRRYVPPLTEEEAHFLIRQHAPHALLDGFGLHCAAQRSMGRTRAAAALHKCCMALARPQGGRRAFRAMAESLAVTVPEVTSPEFALDPEILPASLAIPLADMCFGLFSTEFLPELLGFNLCRSLVGAPVPLAMLRPHIAFRHGSDWYLHESFTTQTPPSFVAETTAAAVHELIDQERDCSSDGADRLASRICLGLELYLLCVEHWNSSIYSSIDQRRNNARDEMLKLVRRKAPYAAGYHRNLKLGGESMDMLLRQPEILLDRLAASRYISAGLSRESRLLARSVAFGGPMFRVFDESELRTIERWIDSLAPRADLASISTQPSEPNRNVSPSDKASVALLGFRADGATLRAGDPLSIRELYYRLINLDENYAVVSSCHDYALDWLKGAAADIRRPEGLIDRYGREELREWLKARLEKQRKEYRPIEGGLIESREATIAGCLQMSPMIFIDGAWLQNWGRPQHADSALGSLLFKIYSDEIGNGDVAMNHPNIFRQLLESMGINLPNEKSREFSQWDALEDDSFRVPVFWMSLSQFPKRFLPETLGLNLAMELSGVGGSYRTARELLVHHGFNPLFVDVHDTIDNADAGHTAVALRAIEIYMDEVAALGSCQASDLC